MKNYLDFEKVFETMFQEIFEMKKTTKVHALPPRLGFADGRRPGTKLQMKGSAAGWWSDGQYNDGRHANIIIIVVVISIAIFIGSVTIVILVI